MQRVNNKGWIILLKFNTIITLIIAALMLISFPLGIYIVFIHSDHALLNDTYTLISMPVKIELKIGYLFIIAWFIYIILFVMILLKPKDIVKVTLSIIQSKNNNKRMLDGMISINSKNNYIDKANTISETDRNLLMITIAWFSIFILASKGIDTIQSVFGISMGSLEAEYDNYIRYFIDASIAPLKEEFVFRIILIGLPTYILLARHDVSLTSVLWHPYSKIDINKEMMKGERGGGGRRVAFIITVSALLFALAHILFSSGWSYGKISQAMLGGLILGWLYYRYGFPTAVILHWAINYMLLAYLLFNNGIISSEGYPLINTTYLYYNGNNTFIYIIELFIIINGITVLAIILRYNLKNYIVRLSSWFKLLVNLIFIHLK